MHPNAIPGGLKLDLKVKYIFSKPVQQDAKV
jgi:hypothetical protein